MDRVKSTQPANNNC